MTTNNQMELTLASPKHIRRGRPDRQRMSRSQWWFAQMRQAVEQAVDWKEQTRLPEQAMLLAAE